MEPDARATQHVLDHVDPAVGHDEQHNRDQKAGDHPRQDPKYGDQRQDQDDRRDRHHELDEPGAQTFKAINVVNLRASKYFLINGGNRLQFDVDLFNLFNTSSPISGNFASGPTFAYATAVVPPRIARIGFRYVF